MTRTLYLALALLLMGTACQSARVGALEDGDPAARESVRTLNLSAPGAPPTAGTVPAADATPRVSTPQNPAGTEFQTLGQSGTPPAQPAPDLTTAVRDVGRSARPAVVFIAVRGVAPDEFLQPVPVQGVGSGAIFDPSGLVLTNNHVVENAQEIRVTLPDGRSFTGRVLGRDPLTDLAVVKIDGENLPTIPLGDSDQLEVGDWVVAIGNALGLPGGPTLTAGVVGALGRSIEEPGGAALQDLVQTDAAINPGNSGGPLVNLAGQVVGINTAGATLDQGVPASGLGFAISINSAKPVLQQLASSGRVSHAYLGVGAATVTPALADQNQLSVQAGVIVARVAQGSPAEQAGMKEGDVIVKLADQPITSQRDLRLVLSAHNPGDIIPAEIVRGQERLTVSVTLGETPTAT